MDDLDLVRAARTKTAGPTDAATAAARAKLAARLERPSRFSLRPRFSPLAISIATVAAVAVVATIAFTAFGQGVKGLHDPAVGPSPTPTATGAVWTSPPQIAFDDDCSTLFSTNQVAGFFDTPAARLVGPAAWGPRFYPWRAVIPHNGGLRCMWNDTTTDDATASGSAPWMVAVVLPAEVLPAASDGSDCTVSPNNNSCNFTVLSNGYVLTGTMGRGQRDESALTDVAFPALDAAFRAAAADAGAPPLEYTTRPGDWPMTIDCNALFTDARVWQSMDEEPLPAIQSDIDGWPTAIDDEMTQGHGMTSCESGDYGDFVSATLLPAGSWLEKDVASYPGMEVLEIEGADHAYRHFAVGDESNSSTVWAFSGPNMLTVSADTDELAAMPVAGLLRELDGEPAAPAAAAITPYTGTATCTNLLDASTVAEYEANDWVGRGDAFTQNIIDAPDQEIRGFLENGGIACAWGRPTQDEGVSMFGYGPITPEQADVQRQKFIERGLVRTAYQGGETWTAIDGNHYGTWVFGDGYWAMGSESQLGNVIDEVIANAPEWKNLTSAKGAAAEPATAPYLTTEGLGALRVGQKVASNPYGHWDQGCWVNDSNDVHPPVIIRTADGNSATGTLDWIYLTDDSIPTKSGVRVGDTIDTLLATYGTFDAIKPFSDTTGYIIDGDAGKIVFEVLRVHDDTLEHPNGSIVSIEVYAKSYGVESVHGNGGHAVCLG